MELIDKAAIVAEIEKAEIEPAPSHDQQCDWEDGYLRGLSKVRSILDTLEVKENKELLGKIETEIKRRKSSWKHSDKQYVAGGRDMCDYLLGYIETLKTEI